MPDNTSLDAKFDEFSARLDEHVTAMKAMRAEFMTYTAERQAEDEMNRKSKRA